jgi:hypothetical protein
MISHEYKCVFIHQRKCAGTSIIRSFGLSPKQADWHLYNEGSLTLEPESWDSVVKNHPGYLVFSVVRNPWDRFVSGWKYCQSTRDRSILDVLNNLPQEGHDYRHLTRPQSAILFDREDKPVFHMLLRFETLQEDWNSLCNKLGKPQMPLPRLNSTVRENHRKYFTPDAQLLFNQHFKADIERFGYKF